MMEISMDQESEVFKNTCEHIEHIKDRESLDNSYHNELESNYLFWENIAFILSPLNIILYSVIQNIPETDKIYMKASIYGLSFSIANLGVIYKWRDAIYNYELYQSDQALCKEEEFYNQHDEACDEDTALTVGENSPEDMIL